MQKTRNTIIAVVVVFVVLAIMSAGLVFINPHERGVVISALEAQGYREEVLTPGLHFVIPFAETVTRYSISHQTYTMSDLHYEGTIAGDDSVATRTSDGQQIYISASVIFTIDPTQVIQVHIDWQDRYGEDLVRPLARGITRDAGSQYRVDEIYSSHREELKQTILADLNERLAVNGIVLVDFILSKIAFSPEYAASVEQKQIAEQAAQEAAFVVEQRRQEAEQVRQTAQGEADATVIRAEGSAKAVIVEANAEAEALEMIAAAISENTDLLTYQYIQDLPPGLKVIMVPEGMQYLLPFPNVSPPS